MTKDKNYQHIDQLTRTLAAPKVTERPVPTVYRHTVKLEWFRRFPWRDRLKILLGYNLVVVAGIHCQHNPGQIHPIFIGQTSRQLDAAEHLKAVIDQTIEEKK